MSQFNFIVFLFLATSSCFFIQTDSRVSEAKERSVETLQKATVRPKEQAKFMKSFQENPAAFEAYGIFSYGGFADDGQIQIILTPKKVLFRK